MLVPVGVTSQRQRAKFIVRIYRADGLPRCFLKMMMMINDGDHDHDDKDDDEDDDDHDALPPKNRMNSSIVANLKHAFGATSRDLVCLNIILVPILCESVKVKV